MSSGTHSPSPPGPAPGLVAALAETYSHALLTEDHRRAAAAIEAALVAGLDATTVVCDLLAPAQREIGLRWAAGDLSIGREHRATEVTLEVLERVRRARQPSRRLDTAAVVCAAPGELHTLPARCFATLLDCSGWEVDYLGAAPPGDELVEYVAHRRPALLALSISQPAHVEAAVALCRGVGGLPHAPLRLLGGAALAGRSASELAADVVAADARTGLAIANARVGPPSPPDLGVYLDRVGRRIHELRRGAGLSQATLAERAGLTRPYLGAVERGRQNITLDAGLRIAGALGVSMTELLAQEAP
jgi:methanogenic corrinoid protein MtbC1/DNA-binding XRE family transcriptional regulator